MSIESQYDLPAIERPWDRLRPLLGVEHAPSVRRGADTRLAELDDSERLEPIERSCEGAVRDAEPLCDISPGDLDSDVERSFGL
jgi:hypothetical protein